MITNVDIKWLNKSEKTPIFSTTKNWRIEEVITIFKIIRKWAPDIVHIQYPGLGYGNGVLPWLIPLISFLMGKKVVQTWHEGYSIRDANRLFLISIIPSSLVFVRPNYEKNLHTLLRWSIWKKPTVFIQNASMIPIIFLSEDERIIVKKKYLKGQKRLVVFFGFIYPHKGVELLYKIADPNVDQIVIAGEIKEEGNRFDTFGKIKSNGAWNGKVSIVGFLPATDLAELLAIADAVILPFRNGGGEWNSSIHGALSNGGFVITTSLTRNGYDKNHNIYFAKPNDIQEMRHALNTYAGIRRKLMVDFDADEWKAIAEKHHFLYKRLLRE
jgi:glycosyltransferase involved in cell wall biosynthesis